MKKYILSFSMPYLVAEALKAPKEKDWSKWIVAGVVVGVGLGIGYVMLNRKKDLSSLNRKVISQASYRKVNNRFKEIYLFENVYDHQSGACLLKDEPVRRAFLFEKCKCLIGGEITEDWLKKEIALRANSDVVKTPFRVKDVLKGFGVSEGIMIHNENSTRDWYSFLDCMACGLKQYRDLPLYKKQLIYLKLLIDKCGIDFVLLNMEFILSYIKNTILLVSCSNYELDRFTATRLSHVIWLAINDIRLNASPNEGSFIDLVKKRLKTYLGKEYMNMYKKQINTLLPDYEKLLKDSIFVDLQGKAPLNLGSKWNEIQNDCKKAFLEYERSGSAYRARKDSQILSSDVFLFQKQFFLRVYLYSKLDVDFIVKHFESLESEIRSKSIDSNYISEFSLSDASSLDINSIMRDLRQAPLLDVLTHKFKDLSVSNKQCFYNFIDEVVYYGMSQFDCTDPDFTLRS